MCIDCSASEQMCASITKIFPIKVKIKTSCQHFCLRPLEPCGGGGGGGGGGGL